MKAARGIYTYPLSLAAIFVFTCLLSFALWRLSNTEEALRNQVGDNMLWSISRAQVAAQRLDMAVARTRLGDTDKDELALRYDVLLSRLTLLEAGPQRRYLAELGHHEAIDELSSRVRALEDEILSAGSTNMRAAGEIHSLLSTLASEFGRAANRSMVAQWNETGERLDAQHAAVLQVIAIVVTILALGAFISWRMLAALQSEQRAQLSLLREKEIREAYRSFVSLVSHQFRTPLSVIDSSMQRILRKGPAMPHAELARRAGRVREVVASLTQLMEITLHSMKLEAGQIDINMVELDVVAELERLRQSQMEDRPDRTLRIDVGDEVPARITADPLLLQEILGNLIVNAVTYSPQSEPVTIRVSAGSNCVHIAVEDRGIGIPEAEKERVFQPFFRASTATDIRGVGIGLHLSRRIARMMGGDVTFESTKGVGSTFTLMLTI